MNWGLKTRRTRIWPADWDAFLKSERVIVRSTASKGSRSRRSICPRPSLSDAPVGDEIGHHYC